MVNKPQIELCPCCGYDYGSYLPRHCPDSLTCTWFKCKECGAVTLSTGANHFNDKPHPCVPPPEATTKKGKKDA